MEFEFEWDGCVQAKAVQVVGALAVSKNHLNIFKIPVDDYF
jgi:hypothetical protein